MARFTPFAALMLLALPAGALAQNAPTDSTGRPVVSPEPPAQKNPLAALGDTLLRAEIRAERSGGPIAVDGVLSEPIWQNGNAVVDFKQRDPIENGVPSQRTEVRVAYDEAAIYIGAHMFDTAPDSIYQGLSRRDNDVAADRFTVYLDPLCDRRTGYYFRVNASGTVDGTLFNDGWDDDSWDGVWHASVKRGADGWTTEMRIPFSQLRFASGDRPVWGINFSRCIMRHSEWDYVVFQPKQASGFVSRFPNLVGIQGVHAGHAIEIIPYVTSKYESFETETDQAGNVGGDLRMGLGTQLSLVGTVNPDFGQVEVDPAVVNLSDVETYFGEKRPFFVEGGNIFRFGNQGADNYWGFNWPEPTFFYSRRIGRTPTLAGDVDGAPVGTTILGAGKVTGKLAGMDFGSLLSATQREMVNGTEIEPATFYGVARGLKSLSDGKRGIGLMGTAAARSFDDPNLEDYLNSGSYFTGVDGWTFLDKEKMWVISGWSGVSLIEGSTSRITSVQQNSLHYFQRPDAGHVEVDPNATRLFGHGTRVWLNKQKGATFVNSAIGYMSQGFDVNDVGFQSRADVINFHAGGGRKWTDVTKVRKYTEVFGALFGSLDMGGVMTGGGLYAGGFTEFANNWSWDYSGGYYPEHLSNRLTRGGPLMLTPTSVEANTYFDTDGKRTRFYYININTSVSQDGSWYASTYPAIDLKPATNLKVSIGPGIEQVHQNQQWVGNYDDATATSTFGGRYVFSQLDQTTVSANFRINASFTPNLSLQLFMQPYLSAGDYQQFKELARPRTRDFLVYGENGSTFDEVNGIADPDGAGPAPPIDIGNPDFNYVSLRGNMVLRWEYRPGSTFFLVWTQDRSDTTPTGDFEFSNDMDRLTSTPSKNIFLAKFTYHLGL
jgi:hypothetical protein